MKRAVSEKRERIMGEEHLDTVSAMNRLANIHGDLREVQECLRSLVSSDITNCGWLERVLRLNCQ